MLGWLYPVMGSDKCAGCSLSLPFPTKKHHLALTLGLHHPLPPWPSGSVAQRLISMRAFDECSRKADRKCHHQKCVPLYIEGISSFIQFSLVTQSCLILCDPMDCSMPGFPVHHQLPELVQTHVHQVSDATQSSHPLSSPSPPTFSLSQHHGLFQ